LDVDYVIQRSETTRLLPDISLQHFAGHDLTLIPHQIFEYIYFARSQGDFVFAAVGCAGANIQPQVVILQG
jgi:hypothetical protein